jgi:predicted nuclease of restriction endonuclease-like (RecB) superfamily
MKVRKKSATVGKPMVVAARRQSTARAHARKFDEVLTLIEAARRRAYQAINTELVDLYWQLGEYISRKLASAEWGDGVVEELAATIARQYPGMRGYTRPNLFRMRQFYEAYRGDKKVSALLRQLPWTHHLLILGQAKLRGERNFYILAAITAKWTSRELERQLRTQAFRRSGPKPGKVSAALAQIHPTAIEEFKNAYSLEFLDLRGGHSEADLHAALLRDLGRFITELGRDFCFVGSEYPVQVGNQDFAIDLVFFHRGLSCLVAFELKVRKFEPADLGQLSFYIEALDRDVKKPHERPSIGVLLCATKDDEVVEYALAAPPRRPWSPSTRRCYPRRRCFVVSSTNSTRTSRRRGWRDRAPPRTMKPFTTGLMMEPSRRSLGGDARRCASEAVHDICVSSKRRPC